jgi:iron complex outermembrane receptor protein
VPNGGGAQSVLGNALPQAPRNKFAINVNYTWDLGPGDLIMSGSYIWKDESFSGIFNTPFDRSPAWDQIDLRATWRDHDDRYEVILFVKNVTDSIGYEAAGGAIPTSFGQVNSYVLTQPRLYGIEFHYRWR